MNKLTWFKFFTGAWLKDPALRACSPAARGLWIDLLCLMSEAPRRGYLETARGQPYSDELLAKLTGMSQDEVSRLKSEIVTLQVASQTRRGTLYSRKMSRDEEQREQWRERQQKHRSSRKATDNSKKAKTNGHEDVTRYSERDSVRDKSTARHRDQRDMSRVELRVQSDRDVTRSCNTSPVTPPTPLPPSPRGEGGGRPNGADASPARAASAAAALAPAEVARVERIVASMGDKPLPPDVSAAIESFLKEHADLRKPEVQHDDQPNVDQRSPEDDGEDEEN
jgi:hypothetical protein